MKTKRIQIGKAQKISKNVGEPAIKVSTYKWYFENCAATSQQKPEIIQYGILFRWLHL